MWGGYALQNFMHIKVECAVCKCSTAAVRPVKDLGATCDDHISRGGCLGQYRNGQYKRVPYAGSILHPMVLVIPLLLMTTFSYWLRDWLRLAY